MARGTSLFDFGQYTFASWARRGAANAIMPNGSSLVRAQVPMKVSLNGNVLTQPIELLGPADITGILKNAIVRTEPLNGNYNFEWSMLPYIEFYDEDFAWRYTPDAPDTVKKVLAPWLALVVVKPGEFTELPVSKGELRAIRLQADVLPLSAELHLWAHMHTGEYAGTSATELSNILLEIGQNFIKDPDGVTSRIISPRRLEKQTLYHAFLVPSFESGRLAGLGENYAATPARQFAWPDTNRPATLDFPIYYSWTFATTDVSFEDLLSKMKTGSTNPQVGVREMDTGRAGYIKAGSVPQVGVGPTAPPKMGLEGALRTHATASTEYVANGTADVFQKDVASLLNLYDKSFSTENSTYAEANMKGDAVLTIPLYGRPYVNVKSNPPVAITRDGKNWYSAINFDARNRVAAGLGTRVIQKEQETFMQSAWYQLQALKQAANNIAAIGTIMDRMRARLMNTSLIPVVDFVAMAGNMSGLIKNNTAAAKTVLQQLTASDTPNALINSATRRVMRANGNMVNRLQSKVTPQQVNIKLTLNGGFALTNYRFKFGVAVASLPSLPILVNSNDIPTPFDRAFSDLFARIPPAPSVPVIRPFPFDGAHVMILTAMITAPVKLLATRINLPVAAPAATTGIAAGTSTTGKPPAEFLGQPVFNNPMYEPLWKMDKECFLPNIGLIENNSINLLETNPSFINAYMVGINQEMGREMLWRRFPADLTATFFHNFWQADDDPLTHHPADIENINNWIGDTVADDKNKEPKVVLAIRGDLLRKFPNTVILAAKIKRNKATGKLEVSTEGDFEFPAFYADIPPDLKFIGFDLTVKDVFKSEDDPSHNARDWYFIIMEPVGEPRFGLDAASKPAGTSNTTEYSRNDLAWDQFKSPALPGFLTVSNRPGLLNLPAAADDKKLWGKNAAGMAKLLFQQPYTMIIKATDLLKPSNS